ncbi:hypothetical protein PR048_031827 [Dryococelus australis]|uniref:PiggyBac transposable element-derived protein domain-containing protein n=1 Tax=Dryococelus australis TaxID=614101 RepID=A0ABQ9G999_9NEOP|nr:hypothetical protein PR048_031827 [Dryococelus australis]
MRCLWVFMDAVISESTWPKNQESKGNDGLGLSSEEKKTLKPTQCIIRLCKAIIGSNRNITTDNYFPSVELANELL